MFRRREKSHSFTIEEKCVGFHGAGGSCVPAPESSGARFWRGSGARLQRECRFSRRRGKLSPGAEKAVSRHRVNIEEKCVGFPGAGGSCAPAPGKLFPGAGERSHYSFTIEEKYVSFPGAGGSCVSAPGKLFPGAEESCVPVPRKAHIHAVSKKNVRFSRRQGSCPGAGKAVSRRRGKLCPGDRKAVSRRRGKVSRAPIGLI